MGRAIMEADPPNTKRIEDLEFHFEVGGNTLAALGSRAAGVANELFGTTSWEFVSMRVTRDTTLHGRTTYTAEVWTRAT